MLSNLSVHGSCLSYLIILVATVHREVRSTIYTWKHCVDLLEGYVIRGADLKRTIRIGFAVRTEYTLTFTYLNWAVAQFRHSLHEVVYSNIKHWLVWVHRIGTTPTCVYRYV
jgi:hypothetical protein